MPDPVGRSTYPRQQTSGVVGARPCSIGVRYNGTKWRVISAPVSSAACRSRHFSRADRRLTACRCTSFSRNVYSTKPAPGRTHLRLLAALKPAVDRWHFLVRFATVLALAQGYARQSSGYFSSKPLWVIAHSDVHTGNSPLHFNFKRQRVASKQSARLVLRNSSCQSGGDNIETSAGTLRSAGLVGSRPANQ